MAPDGSVSLWIASLRTGDATAVRHLWSRYIPRLIQLAGRKLRNWRGPADAEDVALSAFGSFCRRASADGFPHVRDRHDLWRLLAVFTARKASRLLRDAGRLKRGGKPSPDPRRDLDDLPDVEQIPSAEPTPEFAAQLSEECQRLFHLLGDSKLQDVAQWKLEGYTNDEIAGKLGCAPRTVERKLGLIRATWEREVRA